MIHNKVIWVHTGSAACCQTYTGGGGHLAIVSELAVKVVVRAGVPSGDLVVRDPIDAVAVVNGALFQLTASPTEHKLDIVLVHGLALWGEDPLAYRMAFRDARARFGLAELLSAQYPDARILSIKWNSNARGKQTATELSRMACDNLLLGNVGQRPLVLIGHSMGGLLIKDILCHADSRMKDENPARYQKLLRSLKGVVFIATPHAGSALAQVITSCGGPLVRRLRPHDEVSHQLQHKFQQLRGDTMPGHAVPQPLASLPVLALAETDDTVLKRLGFFGFKVGPSAQ